ncbi:MAG: sensor histidine kinase [Candidatus Thorarchaeota archaeon]
MPRSTDLTRGDYVLLLVFAAVVVFSLAEVLSGAAFIEVSKEYMATVLALLMPLAMMMSGIILIYSIAQYVLQRRFRHVLLILLAVNMILTSIFYFITNESMTAIFTLAGRERNRTIVAAFGLPLVTSVVFAGVSERFTIDNRRMLAAVIWGGVINPAITLWFLLSPEPVFVTTMPGGGLTPAVVVVVALMAIVLSVSLWKYYSAWRVERNRLDLAVFLGVALWLYSIALLAIQSSPLQIMEIIWFSVFISGEGLFAIVTVTYEIIQPQRTLAHLVEERTRQLNESKREIEFYLNVWGHKIGNLLQSMMLYLEMLSMDTNDSREQSKLADAALLIGNETDQINQQVAALIRLKEQEAPELGPVLIHQALEGALGSVDARYGMHRCVEVPELQDGEVCVFGDEFVELALVNLLSYVCKHFPDSTIDISGGLTNESVSLFIRFTGPHLPRDVEESLFSQLQSSRTTLSLDLFTVKILMRRFKGDFEYSWDKDARLNQFTLVFRRVPSSSAESDITHKHVVTEEQ